MSNAKQNKNNQRKSSRADGNRSNNNNNNNNNSNNGGSNNNGGGGGAGGGGGGGSGGGGQNGRNSDKSRNNNNRRRKGPRKKKVDPRVFWGDAEQLAQVPDVSATITTNPSAVVLSLGRPPLSGQQNAAEHYFAAVYDRAVNLAAALAAAGDLIEPEDLASDRDS